MANSTGVGFPTTNLQKGHTFHDLDEGATYIYINGDPRLQSSWRLVNGVFPNNPNTTLWGLAQAGATWYNQSTRSMNFWDGFVVRVLSVQPSSWPFINNVASIIDNFMAGSSTTSQIGEIGWTIVNGTISPLTSSSSSSGPGIYRRDTGAVINTHCALYPRTQATVGTIVTSVRFISTFVIRPVSLTLTALRIGFGNSAVGNPPNDGIYFEKLSADTNWFAVNRASSSETRTDTGIAITANQFYTLAIHRTATGIEYYIDNVLVATIDQNITSVALQPVVTIENLEAANKSIDIDRFELYIQV